MREKWIVETKKGDFNGLSAKLKVSPLAVRCLMNRGVESEQGCGSFYMVRLMICMILF